MGTILIYLSYFSVMAPLILLALKARKYRSELLSTVALLLTTSALSDFASFVMIKTGHPSLLIANIYITLQFFILCFLYYSLLEYKAVVYAGAVMFIIAKMISLRYVPITEFDNWNGVSSALIMVVFSVTCYFEMYEAQPTKKITTYPPVWINTAVCFYFSFSLFLFLFSNYVFVNLSEELSMTFWAFHNVNNIIKNILFAVGIYWAGKAKR